MSSPLSLTPRFSEVCPPRTRNPLSSSGGEGWGEEAFYRTRIAACPFLSGRFVLLTLMMILIVILPAPSNPAPNQNPERMNENSPGPARNERRPGLRRAPRSISLWRRGPVRGGRANSKALRLKPKIQSSKFRRSTFPQSHDPCGPIPRRLAYET